MFRRIDHTLSSWHVAALWLLAAAVMAFLVLVSLPELDRISGGVQIFDMRMTGYAVGDATAILAALGDHGRRYYRSVQLLGDLFLPPLLFLAQASLFLRLTRPGGRFALPLSENIRVAVVGTALVGFLADWGENAAILAMLLGPDPPSAVLVGLGSTLTTLKAGGLTLSLAALVVTIVLAAMRSLFARRRPA